MNKLSIYSLVLIISCTCSGFLLLANEEQSLGQAIADQTLHPSDNDGPDEKNSEGEMPKEEKTLLERTKFFAKGFLYSCVSLASCFGAMKALEEAHRQLTISDVQTLFDESFKYDLIDKVGDGYKWKEEKDGEKSFEELLKEKQASDKCAMPMALIMGTLVGLIGYTNYKFLLPEAKKNLLEAFL